MKTVQLPHIDNNHYFLTATQAKQFSIDGKLPQPGYEKRADLTKLKSAELGKLERYPLPDDEDNLRFRKFEHAIHENSAAWIKQTPLSWFAGKPVKNGVAWSVNIFNP